MSFQKHLLAALLTVSSTAAMAADTTTLTINGVIKPPSCTPAFSGGGIIDYGDIPSTNLNAGAVTELPAKSVTLTVNCPASAKIAVSAVDNRRGTDSTGGVSSFGLGKTPADEKIGYYTMNVDGTNATVDGAQPTGRLMMTYDGVFWSEVLRLAFDNNAPMQIAVGGAGSVPAAGLVHVFGIDINTYIAKTSGLTLNTDVPLDGSSTFTVHYL